MSQNLPDSFWNRRMSFNADVSHYMPAKGEAPGETKSHWQNTDGHARVLLEAMPIACGLMTPKYELVEFNRAAVELFALKDGEPFLYENPEDGTVDSCHGQCDACDFKKNPHNCDAHKSLVKNWRHTIPGYLENPERWATARTGLYQKAAAEGPFTLSMDRITLHGELIHCEITIVPVLYDDEQGFALYIRDMRETRLRELAQEESRIKTQFLARMSHEIRTPMNAVLGITEIELQKGSHPPATEEAFLRIHSQSKMLLSIINEILDLSKVEAGKMEIVPVEYDTSGLVVDPVQLNLMNIGSKQINFDLIVDESLPVTMLGDEIRIKQVINNFLSNAIKYTDEGQVTLSFGCEKLSDSEIVLIISVKDTGQGMTSEQLEGLFEKEFTRFNIQHNRTIEGSGLGMTIAYNLVSLMGGTIEVDSQPGAGSTFTMRIPQTSCGESVLGKYAAENLQNLESVKNSFKKLARFERVIMPYGRVLIVDDVESNLFVAKGLLEPYKMEVVTAESGFEAISLVKSGQEYDIIFMDHMMPEMDGIEAARALTEMGYCLPIIALTANIMMGQEEIFLNAGFAGYISKPIDAVKLDHYLNCFIRDKQPAEVLASVEKINFASSESDESNRLHPELIKSFLRDAKRVTSVLTEILQAPKPDANTLKLYTINTHAMKSALANINEAGLSDFAYTLEKAGRDNDTDTIRTQTPVFLERLAETAKSHTPEESHTAHDDDPDFLRRQLKIIHDACEAYDKKTAKAALTALTEKIWSLKTKETLDTISALLLHSDFEAVAEMIAESL
ncbi:MAG: ATP-binding protein [Defluviitaleaceae bacterium]|nr:ATP-binding protein [Defluviitaleaceae bacterium]